MKSSIIKAKLKKKLSRGARNSNLKRTSIKNCNCFGEN